MPRLESYVAHAAMDIAGHGNRHHTTIRRIAYPPYGKLLGGQFALFQKKIGVVMVELHAVAVILGPRAQHNANHNFTIRPIVQPFYTQAYYDSIPLFRT